MKKRILSILLLLIMVLTLIPVAAFAIDTKGIEADSWKNGEHVHDGIVFEQWDVSAHNDTLPDTAGNYFLSGDLTLSETWKAPSGTTNLCLNGYVIQLDNEKTGSVIDVPEGSTLNLYDCGTTEHDGYIDADGLWHIGREGYDEGTCALKPVSGGIITGGKATTGGGVCNLGTFTMNAGTIIGNKAETGGGVYNLGTFTMNGGTIIGNTATNGGGIYSPPNDVVSILVGGTITGNTAESGGGLYYKSYKCFAAGTPITMADGTRKAIETLNIGDLVRVFDHETGEVSSSKLFDFGKYPEKHKDIVVLHFTNDIDITIVYGHSFFEKEQNKYVPVTKDNVETYIGHEFYNVDEARFEKLIGYDFIDGEVDTYIISTENYLNCVANGMLSNEDGLYTTLANIFEYEKDLKIDADKKVRDIEKYGLYKFENLKHASKETYDALNIQYMNVAFGKGMITQEEFDYIESYWTGVCQEYCDVEEEKMEEDPVLLTESLLPSPSEDPVPAPTDPGLYVGGSIKISGNNGGNLYLTGDNNITIGTGTVGDGNGVIAPTKDMIIGVTLEGREGQFSINGKADDVLHFVADNPDYYAAFENKTGYLLLKLKSEAEAKIVKFMETEENAIYYETLNDALAAAGGNDTVVLLKDITTSDVAIGSFVLLDLNNHLFETTGTITNAGTMKLYQKNAGIIDRLLFEVSGSYGAGEELMLYDNQIIIPEGTFFTNDINTRYPINRELTFVIFEDDNPLVWNLHAPAGVNLSVTDLILGGDIPSAEINVPTMVSGYNVTLSSDITIGSDNAEYGEACLFIETRWHDEVFDEDETGTFNANGHKITLKKTGKVIVSSDVIFNESDLISGVDGLSILKSRNWVDKTVTYYLGIPHIDSGRSTPPKKEEPKKDSFVDVLANDYFYDAVQWAAANGITSGIDTTHFNPSGTTTRAEMITFLWRMAGSPKFEDSQIEFKDIKKTDYFYDAVIWGWNIGIINGKSEAAFAPDDNVTRGETVTFIYRYAKVAGGDLTNPFGDVKQGEFYYYPVLWAANNEITSGVSPTTFNPSSSCTRAQLVTFLYRYDNQYGIGE